MKMIQRSHLTSPENSLLAPEGLPGLEEAGKVPAPTKPADGCQGEGEERKVCVVWGFFGVPFFWGVLLFVCFFWFCKW